MYFCSENQGIEPMQTKPNNNSALYTEAGKSKIFLSMLELMRNYGSVFFNAALNKKCFFSQIPKSALRLPFQSLLLRVKHIHSHGAQQQNN